MKTVFLGTPALAVPYLEALAEQTELVAVVTNPDEPSGRGYELHASPVKVTASKKGLPVLQPTTLKDPEFLKSFQALQAEVCLVVAYGKLLTLDLLKIPRHGFLNVHFSLLPAYRGAAPIQRALMQGEKQTGITLFWLDAGMDTGPIFLQRTLPIQPDEDAEALRQRLIPFGVECLREALQKIQRNEIARTPQAGVSSLAPSLKKEEGKIEWTQSASAIFNLIRGTTPWPGAFTYYGHQGKPARLKVLKAQLLNKEENGIPGTVVSLDRGAGFVVKCGTESLQLLQVQPEGKKPMSAWDFWQGSRLKQGDKLD